MNQALLIASDEWRYWFRSRFALGAAFTFLLLIVVTSLLSNARMHDEAHTRINQQADAEDTFLAQPDRHPHRMVHYGHYLFRSPAPLAQFDPGLDSVTGQSIFLEGHRQNTVMFAESASSAELGGLPWLSPALVYQLFAPLIIILLGHASIARERESAVLSTLLATGTTSRRIISGKTLALFSLSLALLVPLAASTSTVLVDGESLMTVALLLLFYFLYLAVWVSLTLTVSIFAKKGARALAVLAVLWCGCCLVLPSLAVNIATRTEPVAGKIETDFTMLQELRKLGDGHNASDPSFQQLRSDTLEKYQVDKVEDLPVNFRGLVALEGEEKMTAVLNQFAYSRMAAELQQERIMTQYSWLTPSLAIAFVSRSIAATDLVHYHRFQLEAEAVRFAFVQGLNQAHVDKLSYRDDINRNKDEASWKGARVDATNWEVLESFQFQPASLGERIENASMSISILLCWTIVAFMSLVWFAGRVEL